MGNDNISTRQLTLNELRCFVITLRNTEASYFSTKSMHFKNTWAKFSIIFLNEFNFS